MPFVQTVTVLEAEPASYSSLLPVEGTKVRGADYVACEPQVEPGRAVSSSSVRVSGGLELARLSAQLDLAHLLDGKPTVWTSLLSVLSAYCCSPFGALLLQSPSSQGGSPVYQPFT